MDRIIINEIVGNVCALVVETIFNNKLDHWSVNQWRLLGEYELCIILLLFSFVFGE